MESVSEGLQAGMNIFPTFEPAIHPSTAQDELRMRMRVRAIHFRLIRRRLHDRLQPFGEREFVFD